MKSTCLLAILIGTSHAFSASRLIKPNGQIIRHSTTPSPTTALAAKRRGRLANNVSLDDDGGVRLISNKQKQKLGSSSKKKKGKKSGGGGDDGATISPLLAEWASSDDDDAEVGASSTVKASRTVKLAASDVFVPFDEEDEEETTTGKRKKSKKKNKKSASSSSRSILSAAQTARIEEIIDDITSMIETTNCDVPALVSNIVSLVDSNAAISNDRVLMPQLKSILSKRPSLSKKKRNGEEGEKEKQPAYRLAWVGGDEAICHIGTSLHKVPLARLQEMFLILGYNRWELLEVIRIIGPFPNVRNTLKGDVKVKKMKEGMGSGNRDVVRLEISYTSMIDGTGKELLAGKEENVKVVNLDVWFANERALVCTVPADEGEEEDGESSSADPLSGNGSNILFFLAEEDVDKSLEKLRAA